MSINVPKSMLPDCSVGETIEMKITGDDGDNFVVSPYSEDEEAETPAPPKKAKAKKAKRPKAVAKALKYVAPDEE